METKKYRVLASIAGAEFSFSPRQIVTAGDADRGDVMSHANVAAYLATGDVEEYVEPKEAKTKTQRAVVERDAQTADARP